MVHPFVEAGINVVLRTEGAFVEQALGALIDDGALSRGNGRPSLSSSKHAIVRNYPIAAHLRFLLEKIRPECGSISS